MKESEANPSMEKGCPQCGAPLSTGALAGLCPACLLKEGSNETATQPETAAFEPPGVGEIAKLFPQLEILALIGKGGMGAVYKARQPALDRLVALKILPPQVASGAGFAERFNREARALAKLSHPNIVAVHEFGQVQRSPGAPPVAGAGETPALPYFIMEFVDGLNLRQLERAGKLSPKEALQIVPQICEALQFAHDEGIIHRDIKPENILLDKKGRVKIADFGIAKIMGREALTPSLSHPMGEGGANATGESELTEAGKIIGTPQYMAPEQMERPETVDHRADIFALGVVFYEMLTGELPLGKFTPPSRKVQVDVRLDEVVLRALEKEPERRYQTAEQFKTQVETILEHAPSKREEVSQKAATSTSIQRILTVSKWASIAVAVLVFGWFAVGVYSRASHHLYSATAIVTLSKPTDGSALTHRIPEAFEIAQAIKQPAVLDTVLSNLNVTRASAEYPTFVGLSPDQARWRLADRLSIWRVPRTPSYHLTVASRDPEEAVALVNAVASQLVALQHGGIELPDGYVATISEPANLNEDRGVADVAVNLIFGLIIGVLVGMALYALVILFLKFWIKSESLRDLVALPWSLKTAALESEINRRLPTSQPRTLQSKSVWLAVVCMLLLVGINFLQKWHKRSPEGVWTEGVWTALPIDDSIIEKYGDAQIRVTLVDLLGPVVLINFVCDTPYREHELLVQYSGPIFDIPPTLTGLELTNKVLLDCLVAPAFMTGGKQNVLAGSPILKGKTSYQVGFVLPDAETATRAFRQIREVHLNKPRGLNERWSALQLFCLRRHVGRDTNGSPVIELLGGMLCWPPKAMKSDVKTEEAVALPLAGIELQPETTQSSAQKAVSSDALREPPKLQFLAWQDEWESKGPFAARHPDGSAVTNAAGISWLKEIPHVGGTSDSHSPTLYLWFSQPIFDQTSYVDVMAMDLRGELLPFQGGGTSTGRIPAQDKHGNVGWVIHSMNRGPSLSFPPTIHLKLRYSIGPCENEVTVQTDALSQGRGVVIEAGVEVRSIGQTGRGGSFVALAYHIGRASANAKQFVVTALAKDGRVLGTQGSSLGGQYDAQRNETIERFHFDVPLAEVAAFRIGSRPVRTMEWANVVLPAH